MAAGDEKVDEAALDDRPAATTDAETDRAAIGPVDGGDEAARSSMTWTQRHRDDLIVVAIFVAARIVYLGFLGVRMDLAFLGFAPHLPDLDLLRHDLFEAVLYEHTQPPGYSLLTGFLYKVSPFPDGITFQVVYLAMGLGLALCLRRIGETLGMGRVTVLVGIGLVVTNPALVSIEMSANYDQPTILMIALLILWTSRYVVSGSIRHLAIVATIGAAIVLTRTVFHPAWYPLLIAGLFVARRPKPFDRRAIVAVAAPATLILLFVAKNFVLFGEPNLTSYSGASLSKIAGAAARPAEREALIEDGTVSPLFGRPAFWGYEEYDDAMPPCTPDHPDIPVLGSPVRASNGSPNLNYECFLPVYKQQGRDARAYITKEPLRFIGAEMTGAQMFFEPALPIVFTPNATKLKGADRAFSWILYQRVRVDPVAYSEFGQLRVLVRGGIDFVPIVLVLDIAAMAIGIQAALRLPRQRRRDGGGKRRQALAAEAAIGLTCVWVTGIGSFLEINENARYRLLIEPYLILFLAWAGELAVRQIRARMAAAQPAGPVPA